MVGIDIVLEGDGKFEDIKDKKIIHITDPIRFSALSGGMKSGKPSMSIVIDIGENTIIFVETSMRAFLTAAEAFKVRYENEV